MAINSFKTHYHQLASYADQQKSTSSGFSAPYSADRGQCPINPLKDLLNRMKDELEILCHDLDQYEQPSGKSKFRKLARHTDRLNQLNQQAQVMLMLTTQSAT